MHPWLKKLFLKRCEQCGKRAVANRSFVRATRVDEAGERYPAAWTYDECGHCHQRTKRFLDGGVETPTAEEWERYCDGPQRGL